MRYKYEIDASYSVKNNTKLFMLSLKVLISIK